MIEMLRMHKLKTVVVIACSLIILAFVATVFYIRLNDALTDTTVNYMTEIGQHDAESIESAIKSSWDELDNMSRRLGYYAENLNDIQKLLNKECELSTFETIYFLGDNGLYYDSKYHIINDDNMAFKEELASGNMKYVAKSLKTISSDDNNCMIVYGCSVSEPFNKEGVNFIGIVGLKTLDYAGADLSVENFDGEGYTTVIDKNGEFITNLSQSRVSDMNNFFDIIRCSEFKDGMQADDVMEKIHNNESFFIEYENSEEINKAVLLMPLDGTDWYMIMNIPVSAARRQSLAFINLFFQAVVIFLAFILIITLFIMREQMRFAKSRMQAKVKNDFFSSMSHEIRTPLSGIIGLNHLMLESLDDRKKLKKYLEKSQMTADYLFELISDFLDYSKIGEGKMKLNIKPICLDELSKFLAESVRDTALSKKRNFEVYNSFEHTYVRGDEIRVRQVVLNILSNALKYTPENGSIIFTISQEKTGDKNLTVFKVADTGCGMSEEFTKHIFDHFSQENNKLADETRGTGLGMAISSSLVAQMGGVIEVDSELGKGSVFTVKLPLEYCDKAEFEEQNNNVIEKTDIVSGLNILVAEDNELNAEIIQSSLEQYGNSVVICENGEKAVKTFSESEPFAFDIILMDMNMPVLNGVGATEKIRKLSRPDAKSVKIFACTANTMPDDVEEALSAGMDDFVTKPIDLNVLISKLKSIEHKQSEK